MITTVTINDKTYLIQESDLQYDANGRAHLSVEVIHELTKDIAVTSYKMGAWA